MTPKEEAKFRQMYLALTCIAKDYLTPQRLRKSVTVKNGILSSEEYLEMAYENIQQQAKDGLRGIRLSKEKEKK